MRVLVLLCLILAASHAVAQDYPTRPITLIVAFPAGGSVDVVAREIRVRLGSALGQSVVVDNRAGAGGTIGTTAAARAAPDGYTLLLGTTSALGVSPAIYKNLQYDPLTSFSPIIEVTRGPFILSVRESLPVTNVAQLLDYARKSGGKVDSGSAGIGTVHHLAGVMLIEASGIEMVHVPYKGGAPAWLGLIAGDIDVLFDSMPGPLLYPGKARPLAIAGPKRLAGLPEIPTFAEAGLPGVEAVFFWAMLAPAGTPPRIVAKLNAALGQVLRDPALQAEFAKQSMDATPGTPEAVAEFMARELPRWRKVVQAAGVTPE